MKCLLYAQVPKGKHITDVDPDYFIKMRHYARVRGWDIVGFISDEEVNASCAEKADLKNLCSCCEMRKDLDAIIAAVNPTLTSANYAALKMIEKKGIRLVLWANRKNKSTKSSA